MRNLFNMYDLVIGDEEPPPKVRKGKDPRQIGAITCNGVPLVKVPTLEKGESIAEGSSSGASKPNTDKYVYDIYISNDPSIGDTIHNQFVSVRRVEEELVFEESDEEVAVDDEEDSNDEGNCRNEYPDSDYGEDGEKFCYGEEEDSEDDGITSQFKTFGISGGIRDLSSDDDEERHPIYSMDDDGADGGGLSFSSRYAAYKARIQQEMADEVVSSASDSD